MRRFATLLVSATFALYCVALVGCADTANNSEKKPVVKDEHGDHDHAHHGPHEGHIAAVGKEEYHVEWTHDDATGKVTMYVLDAAAKKEVPAAAEDLVVTTKTGDDVKEFTLTPVAPKEGKTAQFEVTDKDLVGTLEALSEAITAEVKKLEIDGKTFKNVKLTMDHHH